MNINKKQILISIPILFLIGTVLHFAYDISGKIKIIGLIAPVNESVWEHLKLSFYPIIFWWIIKISNKLFNNDPEKRYAALIGLTTSLLTSIITILSFFYTYTGAFGIKSIVLDIFSLLLGISVGQLLGYHVFKYINVKKSYVCISAMLIITIMILFFIFTFYPPILPIFKDPITGLFGISN